MTKRLEPLVRVGGWDDALLSPMLADRLLAATRLSSESLRLRGETERLRDLIVGGGRA